MNGMDGWKWIQSSLSFRFFCYSPATSNMNIQFGFTFITMEGNDECCGMIFPVTCLMMPKTRRGQKFNVDGAFPHFDGTLSKSSPFTTPPLLALMFAGQRG